MSDKIRQQGPILLAYSFVTLLAALAIIEGIGLTNWVTFSLPLTGPDFARIASGVGSVVLSFGLLLLYHRQTETQRRQTDIQENQESLMEQQFTPYLVGEVSPLNIASAQFEIRNTGDGPAYDVRAEWEVAGNTRTWRIPSLPPGEEYGFPVIVDDGNWLLGTTEIQEYLEENNASSTIEYKIEYKNRFDQTDCVDEAVDFGMLISRSESDEIWSNGPLEEISSNIRKIQRDLRKMRRYKRNVDRASDWQHRIKQTEAIRQLVDRHEELSVEQLNSLTDIHNENIKYRLQALDDANALFYNENTGVVKSPNELQTNETLADF
jgi:hypothetical protein